MMNGEATNTNFIVLGLTRSGLAPTIYHTQVLIHDFRCLSFMFKDNGGWNRFMWTEDKIKEFWTEGVVMNVPLLTEEQCDRIRNDYKFFTVCSTG